MLPFIYDTDIERHAASPEIAAALSAWRALAGPDGRAPLAALQDALGPAHAPHLVLSARGPDGRYRFLAAGRTVVAAAGRDLAGRRLDEALPDLAPALAALYDRALAEGRPLLTLQRAERAPATRAWDRLVLPCEAAGEDRVLVALTPRLRRDDLLDAVLEASRDGIMSLRAVRDATGRVTDAVVLTANARAGAYAGQPVARLVDGSLRRLFPGLVGTGFWELCLAVVETRATERLEVNLARGGLDTWLRITVAPLEDGFVMSFSDVTDLKYAAFEAEAARRELAVEVEGRRALEEELRRLSVTDELTGVLNRRGFLAAVRREAALAARYGHALAVLAVDLDHFKAVNDRFGHAGGDRVLAAVAGLFAGAARLDVDVIGRVGGEEFMILLPHTGREGAEAFAERLRLALAEAPIAVDGTPVRVTTSIGLRSFDPGAEPEQMLLDADKALYRAKETGRNRTVVFETA